MITARDIKRLERWARSHEGRLVEVEWNDIVDHSDSDWDHPAEATPAQVKTCGFIASISGGYLNLYRDIGTEGGHGLRSFPMGCVFRVHDPAAAKDIYS